MYYRYSSYGSGDATWIVILSVAVAVLFLVAGARILKKGGEAGWKILIPIYGGYCLYKVADAEGLFWAQFAVSIVYSFISSFILRSMRSPVAVGIVALIVLVIELVIFWKYCSQMAESFGKEKGFAVGLFLLFPIFFLILAFGSAEHVGYGLSSVKAAVGTWKCSQCGTENPDYRGVCDNCGAVKR